MTGRWAPGDVLIEIADLPRSVIVTECPEMFNGPAFATGGDLSDMVWGYYLASNGRWSGPWFTGAHRLRPHPDSESIWREWALRCAKVLAS